MQNLIRQAHPEWHKLLEEAFSYMEKDYIEWLQMHSGWLPGNDLVLAAFSLPLSATNYILLGESPYPRAQSANGYAFWDNAVDSLWSETGLSKKVNRATSLRNMIKMFLHARGDLKNDFSQSAIARLDKSAYVQTATELFIHFIEKGFLLLNASLVYSKGKVNYHARNWKPFIHSLLKQLARQKPEISLIMFGSIAKKIPETGMFPGLVAEHPYNISFITNSHVLEFFKPLDLLAQHEKTINNRFTGNC
jgi:uracil-DNA glycosylase